MMNAETWIEVLRLNHKPQTFKINTLISTWLYCEGKLNFLFFLTQKTTNLYEVATDGILTYDKLMLRHIWPE